MTNNHIEQQTVNAIKMLAAEGVQAANSGHPGMPLGAAPMSYALWAKHLSFNPHNPAWHNRDRFVLSKGHIAILQYAALAEAGYFPKEELPKTKTLNSSLQGHPDLLKSADLGIEAGTGSLGQGLSIGAGMALALRMDKIDAKTYVILGDGELAEGQVWEAAMSAKRFQLGNLVAIIDKNGKQAQGKVSDRFNLHPIPEKWAAFGWNVIEIDGHSMEEILAALYTADESKDKPTVIIATTVKGKGYEPAEKHPAGMHNAPLTKEQYDNALAALSRGI